MYVIGIDYVQFIKITCKTMYDGQKLWNEVEAIEYETPLQEATIIPEYEKAEQLLKEIQNNAGDIKFTNHNVFGEIIDRENGFDKISYSKELKIFALVPTIV